MATDFLVNRDNLRLCRVLPEQTLAGLQPGQVQLRIDKFALTANNITYAAFGEAMAYLAFFPAPAGWGRIPVWGYADVEKSRHEALPEGERVFGYLPTSTHLTVQADHVGIVRFIDASPHRQKLPAAYQSYLRVSGDSYYKPALEDQYAVLRPLFLTAFLIEDFLVTQQLFGARRVLLSSASSKTALCLARLLQLRHQGAVEVTGLSSAANAPFCRETGFYQQVLPYEALAGLSADTPTVYVDMAGTGRLLRAVHEHFGAQLKYSCMVGGTHWEQREAQHDLPGAKPVFFFAPTHFQRLAREWGVPVLESRMAERLDEFIAASRPWLEIVRSQGPAALERVYRQLLEGHAAPQQAHILSL